jgi:plasmid stabilization system protein ParE
VPRIIVTEGAALGLERCRQFLVRKNPLAARRAGEIIEQQLSLLESTPEIGRPLDDPPWLRELIIRFGDSGYVALYRYDMQTNSVYLLAFRHQKEAGY